MSEEDRLALTNVLEEFQRLRELVVASLAGRPNDATLLRAADTLEATYQLRMYAVFESILARRSVGGGIANYVQYEVGEERTLDPTFRERTGATTIEWWKLLTRDRNALAHNDGRPPALSIGRTLDLLTSYLSMRTERP